MNRNSTHRDRADASSALSFIFDKEHVTQDVMTALKDLNDPAKIRTCLVSVLGAARNQAREKIRENFESDPQKAQDTIYAYARLTDDMLCIIMDVVTQILHPLPTPTLSERLSLCALGGYGRMEMAPFSDLDLLFLTPYKITPWAESVIESVLYVLWDLRLKVGYSTRSIDDCLRLGKEDYTIRTSLLEMRLVCGDQPLADILHHRLWHDLFAHTAPEFTKAKLEERSERHKKQGGQRYVLEPNVKESKGGLRDLQSLFWIAKYRYRVHTAQELVSLAVMTSHELASFERAENFLWAVRCHIHLHTKRPTDKLSFDLQIEIAQRMGYQDKKGRRAVECFMQDYFRHATQVGNLTAVLMTAFDDTAPHTRAFERLAANFPADFSVRKNRLDFKNPQALFATPLNILRIFDWSARLKIFLHSGALRLIHENLHLINDDMRKDPQAHDLFLHILLAHENPERSLRKMNETGVLSAFIPEFRHIVALMQFNMYHHYTVDEHTIQCISHLAKAETQKLVNDLPIVSAILKKGVDRKILYLALLLHDIGKGREEDHSVVGAKIARNIAPRFGLSSEECKTVEWLIRHHLLMSDIAQKRDINDPRTIRNFARLVKNRERLNLLTALTVCDIRGVGPDTWNNWKAMLLRALYQSVSDVLENGMEARSLGQLENQAKTQLKNMLPDWDIALLDQESHRHYGPYWQGLGTDEHVIFAHLLRDISDDEIRIDFTMDDDRDATRACFAMADHPGLFSRMTGALALVGANIVDARTYTSRDGYATAVFWIQDQNEGPFESERLPRLKHMAYKTLQGQVIAYDALRTKDKIQKRERGFRFPTSITFDNEGSEIYTIIEVDTRDRPGLLYDLTRTLTNNNIYISSALIATYGAQAVDSFYVKDMFGLKLYSASRRESLERKLRAAIKAGVERAIHP